MSSAAKARNKARSKRGPIRPEDRLHPAPAATAESAPAESGAADPGRADAGASRPFEGRGAVPGQRPVPGRAAGARLSLAVQVPPVGRPPEPAGGRALPQTPAGQGLGGSFARGYAAPADAVRCAMLGSPPTFWFDDDAGRLTIAVESGRLVASGVAHLGEDLAQLVAAVLLNHEGDPADAVGPVRAALEQLAAEAGHGEVEVTVDLSGSSPRLGWLSRFDPAPWVTWHDWWAAFNASAAGRAAAVVAGAAASGEFDDCFARQGLRVRRCAEPGCLAPLTDRHPAWPGVWSTASGALGPVCAAAQTAAAWPAGLLTARPHRVAER